MEMQLFIITDTVPEDDADERRTGGGWHLKPEQGDQSGRHVRPSNYDAVKFNDHTNRKGV